MLGMEFVDLIIVSFAGLIAIGILARMMNGVRANQIAQFRSEIREEKRRQEERQIQQAKEEREKKIRDEANLNAVLPNGDTPIGPGNESTSSSLPAEDSSLDDVSRASGNVLTGEEIGPDGQENRAEATKAA